MNIEPTDLTQWAKAVAAIIDTVKKLRGMLPKKEKRDKRDDLLDEALEQLEDLAKMSDRMLTVIERGQDNMQSLVEVTRGHTELIKRLALQVEKIVDRNNAKDAKPANSLDNDA